MRSPLRFEGRGRERFAEQGVRDDCEWCLVSSLGFPGTTLRKGLNARNRICRHLVGILERRNIEIAEGRASAEQDLLSWFVCTRDENGRLLTEEEMTDNFIVFLVAGHDTMCALLAQVVRMLALHPEVYSNVLQGISFFTIVLCP
ncbi:hypothetical protein SUGI_0491800 [Cryptomeria japonica]|nr:hypothetical protein SUGI_0491800 [Cryptomeria japonica]